MSSDEADDHLAARRVQGFKDDFEAWELFVFRVRSFRWTFKLLILLFVGNSSGNLEIEVWKIQAQSHLKLHIPAAKFQP